MIQAVRRLPMPFIKWLIHPKNREQVVALFFFCGKQQSIAEYLFGKNIALQDKLDIDFIVDTIGEKAKAERLEELQDGVSDG